IRGARGGSTDQSGSSWSSEARSSSYPEREHRARAIRRARAQDRRREVGVIGRVGKMLGFEAQPGAVRVHAAALSFNSAVQEVAGVELHAWLGRAHIERATARRLQDARGVHEAGSAWPIEYPV